MRASIGRRISAVLRVAAMVSTSAFVAINGAAAQNVVSVSTPPTLSVGEPVLATLTIRNPFNEPVTVDLGQDRTRKITLSVEAPDGQVFRISLPPRNGVGRIGTVSIDSGEVYIQQLLLNEWTHFEQMGTYQVTIGFAGSLTGASGREIGTLPTSTVTISIGPRNEAALRDAYTKLVRTIVQPSNAQELLDTAGALTSVTDPLVVPFLGEVLEKSTRSDSLVIRALARIGTAEALNILSSAYTSPDQERAALARDALLPPEAAKSLR